MKTFVQILAPLAVIRYRMPEADSTLTDWLKHLLIVEMDFGIESLASLLRNRDFTIAGVRTHLTIVWRDAPPFGGLRARWRPSSASRLLSRRLTVPVISFRGTKTGAGVSAGKNAHL
jgi:hypothetical protein